MITETFGGKIPGAFKTEVDIPGVYVIKIHPKSATFRINGQVGQSFQLEKGFYTIEVTRPVGNICKIYGKLMLSDEKREENIRQMKEAMLDDN